MRKMNCLLAGLFMLFAQIAMAQTVDVTGKVTEANGTGIPSASVKEKGTRNGVTADANGNFSIKVKQGATLVFSSIGFENFEMPVTGGTMDVKLKADTRSLNEVVVTGTGVATSKKRLAVSVESIGADKLPQAPTASLDQALVGKIPGAQISSIDGTPGARTNILLRGINSIRGGTNPMIIVDGIQIGGTDISQLDLSNVERVEVVQGAASASIYGAQGANGVIQVFTKKGKVGKTRINFSTSYSMNSYINSGNVSKAKFHSFQTNAAGELINQNTGNSDFDDDGTLGVSWVGGSTGWPSAMANPANIGNKPYLGNGLKYNDHFAQLLQDAATINTTLSLSGGSEKSDFNISFANNRQESNIRRNGEVNRTNISVNVGTELFKGFKFRSTTQLVYTKNSLHPYFGTGRNNIFSMLNISPFFDLNRRAADGNYPAYMYAGPVSVNGYNYNYDMDYTESQDNTVDILQNFLLTYKVNKFVDLDAKYGINYSKNNTTWIFKNQEDNLNAQNWGPQLDSYNKNDGDNSGELNKYDNTSVFQNFLASATIKTDFQKDFNSSLPITTSTLLTFDYRKSFSTDYNTYGIGLPNYPVYNMNQTRSQAVDLDQETTFITYGYLLNQSVDYGDFGGVSFGFRSDFSSAFGEGTKAFTAPRVNAYIRPSSFDFWKNSKLGTIIPEFKLRFAYGEAGIQPGAFDRYPRISPKNLADGLVYQTPRTIRNPSLGLEKSKELEYGFDAEFKMHDGAWFSGATANFTVWSRKSADVIYDVLTAPSTGSATARTNAIDLSSNGIQLGVNINVYKSKDFTWDFTTNFGKQTSTIDRVAGADIPVGFSGGSTVLVIAAGNKIGQIFGYKTFTSLDQTRLDGSFYIPRSEVGKYQLVNGYVVDTTYKSLTFTNEAYAFGDPNPDFNMSFISSFSYKNYITFGFQFDWISGSHLYNQTREWMYRDGIHSDYDKPVTINGTTAAYTAYYRSAYADFYGSRNGARNSTKDYFYEDASFVRLRNISLGIDLNNFIKSNVFTKLQLVFTGRNILTFTKYTGFDPEVSSGTVNSSLERGIDHNSMPNLKSYQVSLNVGF
jgi:TonB-dependent starch-binding outer membrane protein SusC